MKKIRLTALAVIFTFAFLLTGCDIDDDHEKDQLEAKVEQLEQQVTDLQRSSEQEAASTENEAALPDNDSNQTEASSTGDTLETLETAVNDAVKKADEMCIRDRWQEGRSPGIWKQW